MAGELLASLDDINSQLARANAITDAVDDIIQVDARRVIIGQLAEVFQPTTLSAWITPGTTPGLIRSIAGRLIAAKWYSNQFSEDSTAVPAFAQALYNEALAMLASIVSGALVVVDDDAEPIDTVTSGQVLSFYPDDSAPGPFFTIDQVFG